MLRRRLWWSTPQQGKAERDSGDCDDGLRNRESRKGLRDSVLLYPLVHLPEVQFFREIGKPWFGGPPSRELVMSYPRCQALGSYRSWTICILCWPPRGPFVSSLPEASLGQQHLLWLEIPNKMPFNIFFKLPQLKNCEMEHSERAVTWENKDTAREICCRSRTGSGEEESPGRPRRVPTAEGSKPMEHLHQFPNSELEKKGRVDSEMSVVGN